MAILPSSLRERSNHISLSRVTPENRAVSQLRISPAVLPDLCWQFPSLQQKPRTKCRPTSIRKDVLQQLKLQVRHRFLAPSDERHFSSRSGTALGCLDLVRSFGENNVVGIGKFLAGGNSGKGRYSQDLTADVNYRR